MITRDEIVRAMDGAYSLTDAANELEISRRHLNKLLVEKYNIKYKRKVTCKIEVLNP